MNATLTVPDAKPEYLLIFRNTDLEKRLPETELTVVMQRFNGWLETWSKRGYIKGGQPLGPQGRVLSKKAKEQPRVTVDGPFAEAKEVVGGYVVVQAESIEDATLVAEEWPLFDYDATLEIRPVLKVCPSMDQLGMELYPVGEAVAR